MDAATMAASATDAVGEASVTLRPEVQTYLSTRGKDEQGADDFLTHAFPNFRYGQRLRMTDLHGLPPMTKEKRLKYLERLSAPRSKGDVIVPLSQAPDESESFFDHVPTEQTRRRQRREDPEDMVEQVVHKPFNPLPPRFRRLMAQTQDERLSQTQLHHVDPSSKDPYREQSLLVDQVLWEQWVDYGAESDEGEMSEAEAQETSSTTVSSASDSAPDPELPQAIQRAMETEAKVNAFVQQQQQALLPIVSRISQHRRALAEQEREAADDTAGKSKTKPKPKPSTSTASAGAATPAPATPAADAPSTPQVHTPSVDDAPASAKAPNDGQRVIRKRAIGGAPLDATFACDVTAMLQEPPPDPIPLPAKFSTLLPINEHMHQPWEDRILWDGAETNPDTLDAMRSSVVLDLNDPTMLLDSAVVRPSKQVKYTLQQNKGKHRIPNWKLEQISEHLAQRDPLFHTGDRYNISNDHCYAGSQSVDSHHWKRLDQRCNVTHIPEVQKMRPSIFPFHLTPFDLRHFHRPVLQLESMSPDTLTDVLTNYKEFKAPSDQGRLTAFTLKQLSAAEGDVVLLEYLEEHPMLLMRPGMCSLLRNYYKQKHDEDFNPPSRPYGRGVLLDSSQSPFLGTMQPGQVVQAVDNGLFRAPIHEHMAHPTDFLLVRRNIASSRRTAPHYVTYIRPIQTTFTVGQQLPRIAIPEPSSTDVQKFKKERLKMVINYKFKRSTSLKVDEIRDLMPESEGTVRTLVKQVASFVRGDEGAWHLYDRIQKTKAPPFSDIDITPETICAYESMCAASQRLSDMGYKMSSIAEAVKEREAQQKDEDADGKLPEVDDEAKMAPWILTQNFLDCVHGDNLLDIRGNADPTGSHGQVGYSLLRVANKPKEKAETSDQIKLSEKNIDLRKLPLKDARSILVNRYGMDEKDVPKARWHVIGLVRTYATDEAEQTNAELNYARGGVSAFVQNQLDFAKSYNRAFKGQLRVISRRWDGTSEFDDASKKRVGEDGSAEAGSDGEDSGEESEDEFAAGLGGSDDDEDDDEEEGGDEDGAPTNVTQSTRRVLTIRRTIKLSNGKIEQREQVVTDQRVISQYLLQRQELDAKQARHAKRYGSSSKSQKSGSVSTVAASEAATSVCGTKLRVKMDALGEVDDKSSVVSTGSAASRISRASRASKASRVSRVSRASKASKVSKASKASRAPKRTSGSETASKRVKSEVAKIEPDDSLRYEGLNIVLGRVVDAIRDTPSGKLFYSRGEGYPSAFHKVDLRVMKSKVRKSRYTNESELEADMQALVDAAQREAEKEAGTAASTSWLTGAKELQGMLQQTLGYRRPALEREYALLRGEDPSSLADDSKSDVSVSRSLSIRLSGQVIRADNMSAMLDDSLQTQSAIMEKPPEPVFDDDLDF
eukprot:m.94208 g.94208  ORF g.94208 m.94208 type:complete len:1396 (+) comp13020_c0_seq1:213-4400(+)